MLRIDEYGSLGLKRAINKRKDRSTLIKFFEIFFGLKSIFPGFITYFRN